MKDYERLTKSDWHSAKFSVITEEDHRAILKRLWDLENKIESGELCDREEVRKETAREIVSIIQKYKYKETALGVIEKKYGINLEKQQ